MFKLLSILVVATVAAGETCAAASASPLPKFPGAALFPQLPFARHAHTPPRPPAQRVYISPEKKHHQKGNWQPVAATAPFGGNGAGTPILMTDGTVMIGDNTSNWYRLTPDASGSYLNGKWSTAAALPSNYGPLYFASAILPDGRLMVEGGEYNFFNPEETNLGAIYDPVANAWTPVNAPSGWSEIGDAQSVVLDNGTFMLGNCCYKAQALLNAGSLGWTTTGSGKQDANSEEGWQLLPDGTVLTEDVGDSPNSERYNPTNGTWSSAGSIPVGLVAGQEIGPGVLRPDGTVFVAGATGHSAIYTIASGKWSAGPDFPIVANQQLDVADGPASLLPDGNVLIAASPGLYHAPAYFFEFNGTHLIKVPATPDAPNDSSYNVRLLVLPTGQVLEDDSSNDIEIYTSPGTPLKRLAPRITSVPTTLTRNTSYTLSGHGLNGASQANMYGDDVQEASNYPLVRITNASTGHVYYARTHGFTSMAVGSRAISSATFDVPKSMETGASSLEAVANGIASAPVSVTVN